MSNVHSFDVEIAKMYGVNCAILLQHIWYWVQKNEANGQNFHDGNYWTYNSMRAFSELFPYLSQKQIRTSLEKLRDEKIIETGNYNSSAYDHTSWYSITGKGRCILLSGHFDLPCGANQSASEGEPIPNNIPEINHDIPYISIVDHLNEKAGTRYKASGEKTRSLIRARFENGFTKEDFFTVIDKKCNEWIGTEWEKFLRPETLFGAKFEGYLNANAHPTKGKAQTDASNGTDNFMAKLKTLYQPHG